MILLQVFRGTPGNGEGVVNNSMLDHMISDPIRSNLPDFTSFIFAICALMALFGGLRIYNNWQKGDDDVSHQIMRWGGAIVAVLFTLAFLQGVLTNQGLFGSMTVF